MKWTAIAVIIGLMLWAAPVGAQTFTPTPSPTPSPTFTPMPTGTADYRQMNPPGTILLWAGNSTPPGWLLANGDCVSQATYPQLYAAIGMVFDYSAKCGVGQFALPDLRGNFPRGTSGTLALGSVGGYSQTELTVDNLPAHNHSITTYAIGLAFVGSGAATRYTITSSSTGTTGNTGSGIPFSNLPPYQAFNYIINAGTEALYLPPTATILPSSTPAPTATPQTGGTMGTPAPEIMVYSTVEANGDSQNVAFEYRVTAGDALVSVMLFFACGLMALSMVLRARGSKA